jgi:hypothetical protein
MLSKCANPGCSQILRYLRHGKIFCLSPTPEVQSVTRTPLPVFEERFWLCERCSRTMTLVWSGSHVKLVPLPDRSSGTFAAAVERQQAEEEEPASTRDICREDK